MDKRTHFGVSGIVIGLIALLCALFQVEIEERLFPKEKMSISEKAIEKGKSLITQEEQQSKQTYRRTPIDYTIVIFGVVAIILGLISWILKENQRLSIVSLSLGAVAALWQYVLIAVLICVIVVVLAGMS